jgi:hypothetical protein
MTYPAISKLWATAVKSGDKTIEEVPATIRENVLVILQNSK